MITEFTNGIYTATYINNSWIVNKNNTCIAFIDSKGSNVKIDHPSSRLTRADLLKLSAFMGHIGRQYKQLQPI